MPTSRRRTLTRRASLVLVPSVLAIVTFVVLGIGAIGNTRDPGLVGTISANEATPDVPGGAAAATTGVPAVSGSPAAVPGVPAATGSPAASRVAIEPDRSPAARSELTEHVAVTLAEPMAPADLSGYRWPLVRGRLTLPFGATPWGTRIVEGERFHDGIDLATFCGDRVVAAHDGVVLAAGRRFDQEIGWVGDLGPYFARLDAKKLWTTLPMMVITDDGNGYRSLYAHFGTVVVKAGQTVKAGELIGYEGRTGHASGCHLHYGLFSPLESARFAIDPAVVKRMKVPPAEIARVDPMLVLPFKPEPSARPIGSPAAP